MKIDAAMSFSWVVAAHPLTVHKYFKSSRNESNLDEVPSKGVILTLNDESLPVSDMFDDELVLLEVSG